MALFRMIASRAAKRDRPRRGGSRNSAPPSPISPPRAPITAPPPDAAEMLRVSEVVDVLIALCSAGYVDPPRHYQASTAAPKLSVCRTEWRSR
jgi:hypothetical protein